MNRKINYISTDKQSAIDSFGREFIVGETVAHQDKEVGTATIQSFEISEEKNEVKVNTNKGFAHLDFIEKVS